MEFSFSYPLDSGQEITVTVDAAGDDCLIALSFPHETGDALDRMLASAHIERELIEAVAFEKYQERLGEIRAERRAAGVAGEGAA